MSNCINCGEKLNFLNKPLFGNGKLKDESELCLSCFSNITKVDDTSVESSSELIVSEEFDELKKKYPKWYSGENITGICYKAERINSLTNPNEEIVNYKSDYSVIAKLYTTVPSINRYPNM